MARVPAPPPEAQVPEADSPPPTSEAPRPVPLAGPEAGEVPAAQWPTDARVTEAKRLLAKTLAVNDREIQVASVENLEWSNGAMGCPRPDMAYTQALVPGYRVVLEHAGTRYSFHGRTGGDPFLCESPQ